MSIIKLREIHYREIIVLNNCPRFASRCVLAAAHLNSSDPVENAPR